MANYKTGIKQKQLYLQNRNQKEKTKKLIEMWAFFISDKLKNQFVSIAIK